MSDKYRAIYVPLSKDEFIALQQSAQGEGLHPRDQARYLLRSILLRDQSINNNTVALDLVNRRDRVVV